MYLDILRESSTPFDRFVSHGHTKDPLEMDIEKPRAQLERIVNRALRSTLTDQRGRFCPLIGEAGTGKTHYYWVLKEREDTKEGEKWRSVYIPSPPAQVRMLLHIYTCLVDELAPMGLLRNVSKALVAKYRKRGFLGIGAGMREVISDATRDNPGVGGDVVRALITYEMADSSRTRHIAERWLLGEPLSEDELEKAKLSSVIEDDDVCLATIKLFAEYSPQVLIFYFDELEIPFRSFGEEAEIALLESIKRIYNEIPNILIITACLDTVWTRIYEDQPDKPSLADAALKGRMENVARLLPFTVDDIQKFYVKAMRYFWEVEKNLSAPLNPLFPLNRQIFEHIHEKSHGNPRDAIKVIRDYLDKVLFGEEGVEVTREEIATFEKEEVSEEVTASTEITTEVTTSTETQAVEESTSSPVEATEATTEGAELPSEKLKKTLVHVAIEDDEYAIEVNPSAVTGAAADSISTMAGNLAKSVEIKIGFAFTVKGRAKNIAALVSEGETKIAIDVPSVKSFDRSGGVAAFYAINRCKDGITTGEFQKAILIVPRGTGGAKYSSVRDDNQETISVIEMNQKEAEDLIFHAKSEPSAKGKEIAGVIFPEVKPEVEEAPPEETPSKEE